MCFKYYTFMYVCLCAVADAGEPGVRVVVQVNGKNVSYKGNNIVKYDSGDRITFSCDYPGIQQNNLYGEKIVQKWSSSSVCVDQALHNVSYTIFGDFVDHESEVYCINRVWSGNKNDFISKQSHSVKLISQASSTIRIDQNFNDTIHTIYFSLTNPAIHNCNKSGVNQSSIHMRKIVDGTVYNVSDVEVLSTPAESGQIFYCEIMHLTYNASLHNKVNCVREIFSMTKYEYYNPTVLSTQIGIGVSVVVAVCIFLLVSIILYRNKRNKPPDARPTSNNIYAELILSESQTPRFTYQNRDDTAYVNIIGCLERRNTHTTASVA